MGLLGRLAQRSLTRVAPAEQVLRNEDPVFQCNRARTHNQYEFDQRNCAADLQLPPIN